MQKGLPHLDLEQVLESKNVGQVLLCFVKLADVEPIPRMEKNKGA